VAHYYAAPRPTAVVAAHDRATRRACSAMATSPTREVAGYTLRVAALDSDGETAAVVVLTGVASDGWKERRRRDARTARLRGTERAELRC
jgi:hypothetical protein